MRFCLLINLFLLSVYLCVLRVLPMVIICNLDFYIDFMQYFSTISEIIIFFYVKKRQYYVIMTMHQVRLAFLFAKKLREMLDKWIVKEHVIIMGSSWWNNSISNAHFMFSILLSRSDFDVFLIIIQKATCQLKKCIR